MFNKDLLSGHFVSFSVARFMQFLGDMMFVTGFSWLHRAIYPELLSVWLLLWWPYPD